MNSTCSQLSFEVYKVSVAQNLKFRISLGSKIPKILKIPNFELQKCYIPQKKAEIM